MVIQAYKFIVCSTTVLLLSCLFTHSITIAQHTAPVTEPDSLKKRLLEITGQEDRIAIYIRLATIYQAIDIDSANIYATTALQIAGSKTGPAMLGNIYHTIGNIAVMQDSLDKAETAYTRAANYFNLSKSWVNLTNDYLLLGNIALVKNKLVEALEYYRKGMALAQANKDENVMCDFYMNTGNIHYEAHNYDDALHYYELARKAFEKKGDSASCGMVKENLGLVYFQRNEPQVAREYFLQAISLFNELKDHFNLGSTYMYMAQLYEKEGQNEVALQWLNRCLKEMDMVGMEYAGPKDASLSAAYALLGHIQVNENKMQNAVAALQKAYRLAMKNGQLKTLSDVCLDFSTYWEKRNQPDSALQYYRQYHDFYNKYLDEDNIRKLTYQAAETKFDQQTRDLALQQAKKEAKNQQLLLILAIVIALLSIGLLIFYFANKLNKTRLIQSQLENQNIANELDFRNKELTTTVMHQVKNKEFILRIAEKLKQANLKENPSYGKLVNEILSEIEFDSSADGWKEFEISFQRVHVDFYKKLGENFPDLTSNEMRLCAYLKLNLATKDIAAITYQTTNSIDVARHRLRNKMGLKKEESLTAFLSKF